MSATLTKDRHRALFGVLYAEDFDADAAPPPTPAAEEIPEPEVIEPTYSAAELEAAHAAGHAAGLLEAGHGLAASRVQMLGLIAHGLGDASSAAAAVAEETARAVASTMLGAMAACLPAACAHHGASELQALVRAIVPGLVNEPRIAVRVHPLMASALEAEIATLDCEIAERVVLIPTERLPPGDARISWQDGSVVRDAGRTRRGIQDALAAIGLLEQELSDA